MGLSRGDGGGGGFRSFVKLRGFVLIPVEPRGDREGGCCAGSIFDNGRGLLFPGVRPCGEGGRGSSIRSLLGGS